MARINFVIPKPGLPRKPLLRQTLTQKNQGSNEEIVLCSVNIFIVVTAMVGMTKSPCHLHRCRGTRAYNRGFAILGFIQSLTENARKAGRLADDDAESEKIRGNIRKLDAKISRLSDLLSETTASNTLIGKLKSLQKSTIR